MGSLTGSPTGSLVGSLMASLTGSLTGSQAAYRLTNRLTDYLWAHYWATYDLIYRLSVRQVECGITLYSFLKLILKRFSHMPYQIEAKHLFYKIKMDYQCFVAFNGL